MPDKRTVECKRIPTDRAAFQDTLDKLDIVGAWHWEIPSDHAYAAPLVAMMFNVDPERAKNGTPLSEFVQSIHEEDRSRVIQLIQHRAETGAPYTVEYRVRSADGVTRRILARGCFSRDEAGRPLNGRGIIVDLTHDRADPGIGATGARTADPVSQFDTATDHLVEACAALAAEAEADGELRLLVDMLLLKVGRKIARATGRPSGLLN